MSSSFNTQGSISTNPRSALKPPSQAVATALSGLTLGGSTNGQRSDALNNTHTQPLSTPNSNAGIISSLGSSPAGTVGGYDTQPGLLAGVNSSSQQKVVKTDVSGNTTTTHPAQSNPSVLAQQQALNKMGAGLVEDGIAGPKTSAAIAKYGTPDTNPNTTQGGAVLNPDGSVKTPANPVNQITSTNPGVQAENVGQAGQQTTNEKETQTGLLNAGQATPLEQEYIQRVQNAQGLQNAGALGSYADAGMHVNDSPQQLYDSLIAAPDLAGRGAANRGLFNTFSNIYGSQATQGLAAANTIAGRGLTAAQGAYSGAQTQANRGLGAAENVLSSSLPQQQGLTSTLYNPLDPNSTNGTNNNILDRAGLAGQVNAATSQGEQVQQYKSALQQGQNLQAQLSDLITTFGLNPSDLNVANAGLQKIASNTSDPHYQQLQNYVNDIANTYAQILTPPGGSSTDKTRSIATSMLSATAKGASIMDTMKSLDNAANAKIAGVSTLGSSSSGSSTGGNIWSF